MQTLSQTSDTVSEKLSRDTHFSSSPFNSSNLIALPTNGAGVPAKDEFGTDGWREPARGSCGNVKSDAGDFTGDFEDIARVVFIADVRSGLEANLPSDSESGLGEIKVEVALEDRGDTAD